MSTTMTKRRALALAMALLTAVPAVQAGCQYKQVGSIPTTWVDHRLVIDGTVNNARLKMAIDTGTAWTTLSYVVASRLEVPVGAKVTVWQDVDGESSAATAKLKELSLGRFQWFDVSVVVSWQAAGRPDLRVGANVLLEHDMELDGQRIVFFAPSGCDDAALGYWGDDVPWVPLQTVSQRDLRPSVIVQVRGQSVRALVDSSRPATTLDVAVARRVGADVAGRAASVDAIAIGPEIVRHARLQVGDLGHGADAPEMILGADFVQSHHLLFAMSQKRLYFSYLGGEVFRAPEVESAATR